MLQETGTKNIIFDLGGILFDLNYQNTFDAFHKLAGVPVEAYFTQKQQTRLFDDLETGKIEPWEFRDGLRKLLNMEATDAEIDHAFNAMLIGMDAERIKLLRALRNDYRIFLLSNTNKIHMKWLNDYYLREHNLSDFKSLFEIAWYSFEMGLRKPGTEIYMKALGEAGLIASETIFIDDNEPNIKGALTTGIKGIHLPGAVKWEDFGLAPDGSFGI